VAHRAQVEFDEAEQFALVVVSEVDEGVGCERPLAPVRPEGLARFTLTVELVQAQTDGRRLHGQQHIQLGEAFCVVEELRVGRRPLPAAWGRITPYERVRGTRRPVVERRGPLLPVGTATTRVPAG
jgi:hypothetical protein